VVSGRRAFALHKEEHLQEMGVPINAARERGSAAPASVSARLKPPPPPTDQPPPFPFLGPSCPSLPRRRLPNAGSTQPRESRRRGR